MSNSASDARRRANTTEGSYFSCDEVGQCGDTQFRTIPAMLRASAAAFGADPAVVDCGGSETVRFSFDDVLAHANTLACALMAADIEAGDRIAIWAPNMWEWIVAALASHTVGGVVVPINTRYRGEEAASLVARSGARVLFTVEGFLNNSYVSMINAAATATPTLAHTVVMRGTVPEGSESLADFIDRGAAVSADMLEKRAECVQPDDLCDIIFTSGTTGHPKGVMCTHAQTLRVFLDWADTVGLKHGDRYLMVLPFFHTFGYKAGWLASLMLGSVAYPEPVFDVDVVLKRVERDRITMLPGPPALYQTILQRDDLAAFDLSSLRLAVTGAAVIPVQLIIDMRERLAFETVITGYGLTESTGVVTMCRHGDDPETIATTSGRAIPGVEVRAVDDDGNTVPVGEAGEIVVRGYNVMCGYFNDPENTALAIEDGWLHTGDIGRFTPEGYIQITDRKKDMFIVGGFNAYPAEIESQLLQHPAITEVAVIGVPDARLGEVGCAFVVLRSTDELVTPSANAENETSIIAWCRDAMANFKVPRTVRFIDALPRNPSGKVQKFKLREMI